MNAAAAPNKGSKPDAEFYLLDWDFYLRYPDLYMEGLRSYAKKEVPEAQHLLGYHYYFGEGGPEKLQRSS